MSDQTQRAEEKPPVSCDESTPLQQLLRIVAREVVRRLKEAQTRSSERSQEEK